MIGGLGNDTYNIDSNDTTGFGTGQYDDIIENTGEGTDTVNVFVNANLEFTNSIEIFNLASTAGAINLTLGDISRVYNYATSVAVNGNASANIIAGGAGADTINGGGGNDRLAGFEGVDLLSGGAGNDTFLFYAIGTGGDTGKTAATRDIIVDFVHAADKIDLLQIDANPTTTAINEAFAFVAAGGAFSSSAAQVHVVQSGINAIIEGHTPGHIVPDFMIQLNNVTASSILATDFIL